MERPYLRLPDNPGIMPTAELNEEYDDFLSEGETLQVGFTVPQPRLPGEWDDHAIVFTDKRLIVARQWAESRFIDAIDSVESIVNEEHKSIPYDQISTFSLVYGTNQTIDRSKDASAGENDFRLYTDATLKIWTTSAFEPVFEKSFEDFSSDETYVNVFDMHRALTHFTMRLR